MRHFDAKPDDVVRLTIGKRPMTVVAYSSAGRVLCKWLDENSGRPVTGWFDARDLMPVTPATETAPCPAPISPGTSTPAS